MPLPWADRHFLPADLRVWVTILLSSRLFSACSHNTEPPHSSVCSLYPIPAIKDTIKVQIFIHKKGRDSLLLKNQSSSMTYLEHTFYLKIILSSLTFKTSKNCYRTNENRSDKFNSVIICSWGFLEESLKYCQTAFGSQPPTWPPSSLPPNVCALE